MTMTIWSKKFNYKKKNDFLQLKQKTWLNDEPDFFSFIIEFELLILIVVVVEGDNFFFIFVNQFPLIYYLNIS